MLVSTSIISFTSIDVRVATTKPDHHVSTSSSHHRRIMPVRLKCLLENGEPPLLPRRKNGTIDTNSAKSVGLVKLLTEIRQCERQLTSSPVFTTENDSPSLERSYDFSYSTDPPSSQISVAESERESDGRAEEPPKLPLLVTVETQEPQQPEIDQASYTTLRVTYLLVTLVVMLADGLQGECRAHVTDANST